MDICRPETVYCKDTEGDYKLVLWNYPKDVILPNFINNFNFNVNIEESNTAEDLVKSSDTDITENDLYRGVPCGLLKELYIHIRGINDMPNKLKYIAYRAFKTMQSGGIDTDCLVQLIEQDKLINFHRAVLWGVYRNRSLAEMFAKVTPDMFQIETFKSYLSTFVSGKTFKKKFQINNDYKITCMACRNFQSNSVLEFINHLNRKTSETTYMCRHCGYLKFNNFCAFFYHIFSDKYFNLDYEYCVVCRRHFKSLASHFTLPSLFINSWKAKCSYCDYIAYTVCSYNIHLAYHVKELPYICPECGEYFSFKCNLDKHIKNECYFDYKFKFYVCTCCYMIFSYVEHYFTHLATEHYQRRVKCVFCHEVFPAQRDFLEHRAKFHPESACRYNVMHYCELCPSTTFRAMSLQKHLSCHSEDIRSCIILYKCMCGFYTRHKQKFIEHKKSTRECRESGFTRPQIMKICENCDDVASYNYLKPIFLCEECLVNMNPALSLMNYYCDTCHLVIDFNWNSVLDHFSLFHKKIDLLSVWHNVQMIIGSKKIAPGRYLNKTLITSVDEETLGNFISSLDDKENNPKSSEIFSINADNSGNNRSAVLENLLIRVRSPETINASISEVSQDASIVNTQNSGKFEDDKPNNAKAITRPSTNCRKFDNKKQNNFATGNETLGVLSSEKFNTDKPNNTPTGINKSTPKEIFYCKICDFCTLDKSESIIHAQSHLSFQCFECEQRFDTISERNDHLSEIHGICLVVEDPENLKPQKEIRQILKQQIEGKLSHYLRENEEESEFDDDDLANLCVIVSDSD